MSPRALVVLWLVVAVVIWNVVFDLHVELGVREFLRLAAETRLGEAPEPSLQEMMASSRRHGAFEATQWALVVFGAGCVSAYVRRRLPTSHLPSGVVQSQATPRARHRRQSGDSRR